MERAPALFSDGRQSSLSPCLSVANVQLQIQLHDRVVTPLYHYTVVPLADCREESASFDVQIKCGSDNQLRQYHSLHISPQQPRTSGHANLRPSRTRSAARSGVYESVSRLFSSVHVRGRSTGTTTLPDTFFGCVSDHITFQDFVSKAQTQFPEVEFDALSLQIVNERCM